MDWITQLKNFFRLSAKPEQAALADIPPPSPAAHVVAAAMPLYTLDQPDFIDEPLPHWLSSEDALRDEGVIFGLSASDMEEKTAVIKSFFAHQTADIEQEVQSLSEKIGELNLFLEQKQTRSDELKLKLEDKAAFEPEDHHLVRTSVGLFLAIAICVANYYLISFSLQGSFPELHGPIAFGVLLAGYFTLFSQYSLFHADSQITWRTALVEFGMPTAASVFVFVHALESQSAGRAFALLIFVFFLFLFAGKLFLSNISQLKTDINRAYGNFSKRRKNKSDTLTWEAELKMLTREMDELRIKKWQILPDLNRAEGLLTRYHSKRDSLVKLFESEFKLARSYRDRLSQPDIARIIRPQ